MQTLHTYLQGFIEIVQTHENSNPNPILGISVLLITACKELVIDTPITGAVQEFKNDPAVTQIIHIIIETLAICRR